MTAYPRMSNVVVVITVALLAAACSASMVDSSPTSKSSQIPTAAPSVAPAAPSVAPAATPAPTLGPDTTALDSGPHAAQVMGVGTYPGYTVVVGEGWYDVGLHFVIKYPTIDGPAPVLGLGVWDVGQVFRDPCHWKGQAFDPGPGIDDLVAALVAQPMRNATAPTDVTLASYAGRYLEWSVPADMRSSIWTDFDDCDIDPDGHRDFNSWLGDGMGNRYEQVPGQVDRLWVLDVNGQRLVLDATYSPDTTQGARDELEDVVESLRFVGP